MTESKREALKHHMYSMKLKSKGVLRQKGAHFKHISPPKAEECDLLQREPQAQP